MKKLLTVFLVLCLASFISVVFADTNTTENHSHCVCGAVNCTENHEETGVTDWKAWNGDTTVGTATDTATTTLYLYLENDVTLTDTLDITNVTVYLCLNGKTLTIGKEGYPAVRVGENQKFVLCDCKGTGKITGAKGSAEGDTTRFGAVNGRSGSNFVMYGGSIADNIIEGANGGGVYVGGGTFTMYGGSINNNQAPNGSGGAISVENGTITIYGGEMSGNSAINGGAMHLKGNTGAEIRHIKANHNIAKTMGGALFAETSGVMSFYDSEFAHNTASRGGGLYLKGIKNSVYANIYNIYIHNNSATGNGGGIYLDGNGKSNAISIYDARICDNTSNSNGGGIYAQSSALLNLYGGTISGNTCTGNGGGIRLTSSTYCTIAVYKNTTYIKENTADVGGGISSSANSLILNGKSEIEGNTAQTDGGGVHITRSSSWLIFQNTTITGNTAPKGGGVSLNKDDTGYELEIGGGTSIIGNTSSTDGSACNLYLNNGRMFQFRNTLTGNERIGVSVSKTPTLEEPTNIEWVFMEEYHDKGGDRSNLIIPDNDNYEVIYQNNKHWLIPKSYTVTFDPNNGDEVQSTKVVRGGTLSGFDYPTRDGYTFDAWYADGAAYDFEKPVNSDFTLKARWIPWEETALSVTSAKVVIYRLNKPAVLFVASYNGNRLLDIKTKELTGEETEEYIGVEELGLNTVNATKIAAFLWDNSDSGFRMRPLCESAAAEIASASHL